MKRQNPKLADAIHDLLSYLQSQSLLRDVASASAAQDAPYDMEAARRLCRHMRNPAEKTAILDLKLDLKLSAVERQLRH